MENTSVPTPQHSQPAEQSNGSEQASRLEFELLLKEYETATSYALHWLATDGRDMEFTLLAISGAIVASSFAVENNFYPALLVLSLPFYVLIWSQIHRGIDSDRRLRYIIDELAPRLNEIIHNPPNRSEKLVNQFIFTSYEAKLGEISKRHPRTTIATALPNIGRGLFKLVASVFFVGTYLYYTWGNTSYTPSFFDIPLFALNVIALGFSFLALFVLITLHKQNIQFSLGRGEKPANQQDLVREVKEE